MPSRRIRKRKKRRSLKRRLAVKQTEGKSSGESGETETSDERPTPERTLQQQQNVAAAGAGTEGGGQRELSAITAGNIGHGEQRSTDPFHHHMHHQHRHHLGDRSTCAGQGWFSKRPEVLGFREDGHDRWAPLKAGSELRQSGSIRERTAGSLSPAYPTSPSRMFERAGPAMNQLISSDSMSKPHSSTTTSHRLQQSESECGHESGSFGSWTDISSKQEKKTDSGNANSAPLDSNVPPRGTSPKGQATPFAVIKKPLISTSSEENVTTHQNAKNQLRQARNKSEGSAKENAFEKDVSIQKEGEDQEKSVLSKRPGKRKKRRKPSVSTESADKQISEGNIDKNTNLQSKSPKTIQETPSEMHHLPDTKDLLLGEQLTRAHPSGETDDSVSTKHSQEKCPSSPILIPGLSIDFSTSEDLTDATLQDYNSSTTKANDQVAATWSNGSMQAAWPTTLHLPSEDGYAAAWNIDLSQHQDPVASPPHYTSKKPVERLVFTHQADSIESSEYAADDESTPKEDVSFDIPGNGPVVGSLLFGGLGALEKATSIITKLAKEISPEPKPDGALPSAVQGSVPCLDGQGGITTEDQETGDQEPLLEGSRADDVQEYCEARAAGWEIVSHDRLPTLSTEVAMEKPADVNDSPGSFQPKYPKQEIEVTKVVSEYREEVSPARLFIPGGGVDSGYCVHHPSPLPVDTVLAEELGVTPFSAEGGQEESEKSPSNGTPFYTPIPSTENTEVTLEELRKQSADADFIEHTCSGLWQSDDGPALDYVIDGDLQVNTASGQQQETCNGENKTITEPESVKSTVITIMKENVSASPRVLDTTIDAQEQKHKECETAPEERTLWSACAADQQNVLGPEVRQTVDNESGRAVYDSLEYDSAFQLETNATSREQKEFEEQPGASQLCNEAQLLCVDNGTRRPEKDEGLVLSYLLSDRISDNKHMQGQGERKHVVKHRNAQEQHDTNVQRPTDEMEVTSTVCDSLEDNVSLQELDIEVAQHESGISNQKIIPARDEGHKTLYNSLDNLTLDQVATRQIQEDGHSGLATGELHPTESEVAGKEATTTPVMESSLLRSLQHEQWLLNQARQAEAAEQIYQAHAVMDTSNFSEGNFDDSERAAADIQQHRRESVESSLLKLQLNDETSVRISKDQGAAAMQANQPFTVEFERQTEPVDREWERVEESSSSLPITNNGQTCLRARVTDGLESKEGEPRLRNTPPELSDAHTPSEIMNVEIHMEVCNSMQKDCQVLGMLTLAQLAETHHQEYLAQQQIGEKESCLDTDEIAQITNNPKTETREENKAVTSELPCDDTILWLTGAEVVCHSLKQEDTTDLSLPIENTVSSTAIEELRSIKPAITSDVTDYRRGTQEATQNMAEGKSHIALVRDSSATVICVSPSDRKEDRVISEILVAKNKDTCQIKATEVASKHDRPCNHKSLEEEVHPGKDIPTEGDYDTVETAICASLRDEEARMRNLAVAETAGQHFEINRAIIACTHTPNRQCHEETVKEQGRKEETQKEVGGQLTTTFAETQHEKGERRQAQKEGVEDSVVSRPQRAEPSCRTEIEVIRKECVYIHASAQDEKVATAKRVEPADESEDANNLTASEKSHYVETVQSTVENVPDASVLAEHGTGSERASGTFQKEDVMEHSLRLFHYTTEASAADYIAVTVKYSPLGSMTLPMCLAMQCDQHSLEQAVKARHAETIYQENLAKQQEDPPVSLLEEYHRETAVASEAVLPQANSTAAIKLNDKQVLRRQDNNSIADAHTEPAKRIQERAVQHSMQTDCQMLHWRKAAEMAEVLYHETLVRFVKVIYHEPNDKDAFEGDITHPPGPNDQLEAPAVDTTEQDVKWDLKPCEIPTTELATEEPSVLEEEIEGFTQHNPAISLIQDREQWCVVQSVTNVSRHKAGMERTEIEAKEKQEQVSEISPDSDVQNSEGKDLEEKEAAHRADPASTTVPESDIRCQLITETSQDDASIIRCVHASMREDCRRLWEGYQASQAEARQQTVMAEGLVDRTRGGTPAKEEGEQPDEESKNKAMPLEPILAQVTKKGPYLEVELTVDKQELNANAPLADVRRLMWLEQTESAGLKAVCLHRCSSFDELEENKQEESAQKDTLRVSQSKDQDARPPLVETISKEPAEGTAKEATLQAVAPSDNVGVARDNQMSEEENQRRVPEGKEDSSRESADLSSTESAVSSEEEELAQQQVDLAIDEALFMLLDDEAGCTNADPVLLPCDQEALEGIKGFVASLVNSTMDSAFSVIKQRINGQMIERDAQHEEAVVERDRLESHGKDNDDSDDGSWEPEMGDLFSTSGSEDEAGRMRVRPEIQKSEDEDAGSLEPAMGDLFGSSESDDEANKNDKGSGNLNQGAVPETGEAVEEALEASEAEKIGDLLNCTESKKEIDQKRQGGLVSETEIAPGEMELVSNSSCCEEEIGDLFDDTDTEADTVAPKTTIVEVAKGDKAQQFQPSPLRTVEEIVETEIIEEAIETLEEVLPTDGDLSSEDTKRPAATEDAKETAEEQTNEQGIQKVLSTHPESTRLAARAPLPETVLYLYGDSQRLHELQLCESSESAYQEYVANLEDVNNNDVTMARATFSQARIEEPLGEEFPRDAFSPPVGGSHPERKDFENAIASEILSSSGFWEEVWQSYREECRALWQLAVCEQAENMYMERQNATLNTAPRADTVQQMVPEEMTSFPDEPKLENAVEELHPGTITGTATCEVEIVMPDVFGVAFVEASCQDYKQMRQAKEAEAAEELYMSQYIIENEDCQELIEIFADRIETVGNRKKEPEHTCEEVFEAHLQPCSRAQPAATDELPKVGLYTSLCSHLNPYADSDSEEECEIHGHVEKWEYKESAEEDGKDEEAQLPMPQDAKNIPTANDKPDLSTLLAMSLEEEFKQKLLEEIGQRKAMEQLVEILEEEGRKLRRRLAEEQNKVADLNCTVSQLQVDGH